MSQVTENLKEAGSKCLTEIEPLFCKTENGYVIISFSYDKFKTDSFKFDKCNIEVYAMLKL